MHSRDLGLSTRDTKRAKTKACRSSAHIDDCGVPTRTITQVNCDREVGSVGGAPQNTTSVKYTQPGASDARGVSSSPRETNWPTQSTNVCANDCSSAHPTKTRSAARSSPRKLNTATRTISSVTKRLRYAQWRIQLMSGSLWHGAMERKLCCCSLGIVSSCARLAARLGTIARGLNQEGRWIGKTSRANCWCIGADSLERRSALAAPVGGFAVGIRSWRVVPRTLYVTSRLAKRTPARHAQERTESELRTNGKLTRRAK